GEIQVLRDKSGRFVEGISGNIKGKPPGSKNYLTQLEEALKEYETEKGKTLFKRLIERAFINDQVMLSVVKKFIPDKTHTEAEMKVTNITDIYNPYENMSDEELIEKMEKDIDYFKKHKEYELDYYKKHPETIKDEQGKLKGYLKEVK
ncbi:MAG: hypothetical protein KJ674_02010, partial [Nanoarchaeota archaeon]|nr:hypothetical protein [Nanoarchaeota archaeon]